MYAVTVRVQVGVVERFEENSWNPVGVGRGTVSLGNVTNRISHMSVVVWHVQVFSVPGTCQYDVIICQDDTYQQVGKKI